MRSEIRILDLGCGSGSNLWVYEREGFEAHGIDGSLNSLLTAKKVVASFLNTGFKTHLTNGNLVSLPYQESTFNTAVDVVSLQHLNQNEGHQALSEIYRVLRSGENYSVFDCLKDRASIPNQGSLQVGLTNLRSLIFLMDCHWRIMDLQLFGQ